MSPPPLPRAVTAVFWSVCSKHSTLSEELIAWHLLYNVPVGSYIQQILSACIRHFSVIGNNVNRTKIPVLVDSRPRGAELSQLRESHYVLKYTLQISQTTGTAEPRCRHIAVRPSSVPWTLISPRVFHPHLRRVTSPVVNLRCFIATCGAPAFLTKRH